MKNLVTLFFLLCSPVMLPAQQPEVFEKTPDSAVIQQLEQSIDSLKNLNRTYEYEEMNEKPPVTYDPLALTEEEKAQIKRKKKTTMIVFGALFSLLFAAAIFQTAKKGKQRKP